MYIRFHQSFFQLISFRQRFMLLGSFGLRIKSGEVRLAGATLQASHRVFWVHAPHCLALPVIRVTQTASIEVLNDPQSSGLRGLGGLSPLLRCIWNEPCGLDTAARRTFQFVCGRWAVLNKLSHS